MTTSDDSVRGAGLYIHIPFCSAVCPYCDFAVRTGSADARAQFSRDLIREIESGIGTGQFSEPVFLENLPKRCGKFAGLSKIQQWFVTVIRKDSFGAVDEYLLGAHQRNPNPRAITPRRISRVPPRMVNAGESSSVSVNVSRKRCSRS